MVFCYVPKNKYLYNGKELQNDVLSGTAFNVLDYGARFYDAVLGIWRSPDPLAEKYHSFSPYAYCGNNPVKRVDINGMEWKTIQDAEIAKQIRGKLMNKVTSLNEDASSIKKDIDEVKNNTKISERRRSRKMEKLEKELHDVEVTRDFISDMDARIGKLSESPTVYSFNDLGENAPFGFLSSPQEGEITINYIGGENSFANQAHETVHATQYEQGLFMRNPQNAQKFIFNRGTSDLAEVSAYLAQYVINPRSMPYSRNGSIRSPKDITVKWYTGIEDANRNLLYSR